MGHDMLQRRNGQYSVCDISEGSVARHFFTTTLHLIAEPTSFGSLDNNIHFGAPPCRAGARAVIYRRDFVGTLGRRDIRQVDITATELVPALSALSA